MESASPRSPNPKFSKSFSVHIAQSHVNPSKKSLLPAASIRLPGTSFRVAPRVGHDISENISEKTNTDAIGIWDIFSDREYAFWWNLVLVLMGTILSFIPLMAQNTSPSNIGLSDSTTVISNNANMAAKDIAELLYYRESAMATVAVCIPSYLDTIAEVCIELWSYINTGITASGWEAMNTRHRIVRMNVIEKLLLLMGISIFSITTFVGRMETATSGVSGGSLLVRYICSRNVSSCLTIGSLLMFLGRCTAIWTPLKTTPVIAFVVVASILHSSALLHPVDSVDARHLSQAAIAFLSTGAAIYYLICILCFLAFTIGTCFPQLYFSLSLEQFGAEDDNEGITDSFRLYIVPATHMTALVIYISLQMAWFCGSNSGSSGDFAAYNWAFLWVGAVIIALDIRVRLHEVKKGLDLLDSKRSFVRYISHELRTPLTIGTFCFGYITVPIIILVLLFISYIQSAAFH